MGKVLSSFHRLPKRQTCFGSLATLFLNFLNCLSASKASFPSVARDSSSLSLSESPRSSLVLTNCLYSFNLSFSLLSQAALSSGSVAITSSYSGKRTLLLFLQVVAPGKSKLSLITEYKVALASSYELLTVHLGGGIISRSPITPSKHCTTIISPSGRGDSQKNWLGVCSLLPKTITLSKTNYFHDLFYPFMT